MSRIRRITPNDFEEVIKLIHTTIRISYQQVYPPEVIHFFLTYHSLEELRRRTENGVVLVLEYDETICATGFFMNEEMGGVYVHPDFQNRGFGSQMIVELLKIAVEQNCRYIHLDATPLAKALYLKMGFEMVSPAVQWVGMVQLHYFKMEKYL
jgi:GNAT superfamily N-acetyltransferase